MNQALIHLDPLTTPEAVKAADILRRKLNDALPAPFAGEFVCRLLMSLLSRPPLVGVLSAKGQHNSKQ